MTIRAQGYLPWALFLFYPKEGVNKMPWRIKLKNKVVPVYSSSNTIHVARHVTNTGEEFIANEYHSDNHYSRYRIAKLNNQWVNASQVLILDDLPETVASPDPYKSKNMKVLVSGDAKPYRIVGSTMEPCSDIDLDVSSANIITVDGEFTQYRGGNELYYRLADNHDLWIKVDSSVSVIDNGEESPNDKTPSQVKIRRVRYLSRGESAPQPKVSTLAETEDETTEPEGNDSVVIGSVIEGDVQFDEVNHFAAYQEYVQKSLGQDLLNTMSKSDNKIISNIGNILNKLTSSESELSAGRSFMGVPIYRYSYVHGMPFQFTALSDRRYYADTTDYDTDSDNCDQYGRLFAKTIVADTPMVVFTPGLPRFLTSETLGISASAEEQQSLANYVYGGEANSTMQKLLNTDKNMEYFSLGVTTTEYFKYVNTLTRTSAKLMGIGDMKYHSSAKNSKTLQDIDWGKYNADIDSKSQLSDVLGMDGGVAFAFDPQSGISASLSNQTTESSIASQINSYASQVRELEFIAGASAASGILNGLQGTINGLVGIGQGGDASQDTGKNMFSRIGTGISNVVSGLNMKFPLIWANSTHNKSYSCEMKFVSPYAALFSCWRYVLVPFFHLLPFAAPRATKSVNSYTSPFLIRAYSKGYFNVEMGMIEGMTYKTFGEGDLITADGIPMQIDCDVQFSDLYKTLSLCTAAGSNFALFFNNTGLIDLLGTLSGVNMCRTSIQDRLSLFVISSYNAIMDYGTNFRRKISDKFNTFFTKFSSVY